LGLRKELK